MSDLEHSTEGYISAQFIKISTNFLILVKLAYCKLELRRDQKSDKFQAVHRSPIKMLLFDVDPQVLEYDRCPAKCSALEEGFAKSGNDNELDNLYNFLKTVDKIKINDKELLLKVLIKRRSCNPFLSYLIMNRGETVTMTIRTQKSGKTHSSSTKLRCCEFRQFLVIMSCYKEDKSFSFEDTTLQRHSVLSSRNPKGRGSNLALDLSVSFKPEPYPLNPNQKGLAIIHQLHSTTSRIRKRR